MRINAKIEIPDEELHWSPIRASGPGGQNVNKVASAGQLSFDIANSSLPGWLKAKLLNTRDHRLSKDGVLTIKAQQHRSQPKNREDAEQRLREFILPALRPVKVRKPTKPTRAARERRMDAKTRRSQIKAGRGKVDR
ncbi:MAG: alternative ribosome rescue aminoacyl-tRNA hydrolase ArfB [Opitutales bacterium]